MSFGGNDVDFSGVVTSCISKRQAVSWIGLVSSSAPGRSCSVDFDGTDNPRKSLKPRIDDLIAGKSYTKPSTTYWPGKKVTMAGFYEHLVRAEVSSRGQLVVVGYPQIFAPSKQWGSWRGNFCNFVSAQDADRLGQAAKYLDHSLRDAVDQANKQLGAQRVSYVSRYDLFHTSGSSHELCSGSVEYLNGLTGGFTDGSDRYMHSFHPNNIGHQVTAEALAGDLVTALAAPATATPATQVPAQAHPTTPTPASITDGTSHWDIGDNFAAQCVVAWPTAPTITSSAIEMTMSCKGVPQQFLFVDVSYPDPNLPITPSTGYVNVQGRIADYATNGLGIRELVVQANSVTW